MKGFVGPIIKRSDAHQWCNKYTYITGDPKARLDHRDEGVKEERTSHVTALLSTISRPKSWP